MLSIFFNRNRSASRMSLLVMAALLLAPAALAINKAEWDTLSKGQVVVSQKAAPSKSLPSVEAKILVPRPPEKVWSVVADPEKLMREEDKVKKVKVLSQAGNKQQVEFSVLMTRLLPPFNYVLQQDLSPPHSLNFHRVSGSFRDIQGSWQLTPVENGKKTVLTYTLKLDPGPLVPRGLLMNAVKADLPQMMQNAKAAINNASR